MTVSKAQANWSGTLNEGKGSVKGANGAFEAPFSFATRFEGTAGGTTPEELIGAAHAGCFSMFLAAQLSKAGHPPKSIDTTALVTLDDGPLVTKIELDVAASVPGIDAKLFQEKVEFTKKNCPISKALASVPSVTVSARLI
ncbi:MAG: OsmC family peroxiredoxin [Deltaproteobacteria bacterium]|nr:OsmC family peroxiredoxin [Deltaproteobacteria bacterium]